jgi:MYXO-CTERM domain-containing protein
LAPTLLLALGLTGAAHAMPQYMSDPIPVSFLDELRVFDVLDVDTGYLPGGLSPASVRFFIAPEGGVTTEMDAISYMAWPAPLLHHIEGVPGTGTFSLDGGIGLNAEVLIDLGFLYTGTIPLWTENIDFADTRSFAPLLLDGSSIKVDGSATLFPALEFPVPVVDGLDLFLVVELYPDVSATLTPTGILTYTEEGGFFEQLDESTASVLPIPDDPGLAVLQSSFVADISSVMQVVLEARIELQTFLGPITVYTFPVEVPLVSDTVSRIFDPVIYEHPLPAISEVPEVLDFGEVEVGELVELQIPVENIGLRGLGTEAVVEPSAFSVRPASALIEPGEGGAFTVTFAPSSEGEVEARLVVLSNDPGYPELEVLLRGNALDTDATTDPDDGTGTDPTDDDPTGGSGNTDPKPPNVKEPFEQAYTGCGCATGPGSAPTSAVLLLLVGLVRRRR